MYSNYHSAAWYSLLPVMLAAIPPAPVAGQVLFDFEEPRFEFGTVYGSVADPAQMPGDLAVSMNGVRMSVELFTAGPGIQVFARGVVGGDHQAFFDSTPLQLDNINFRFGIGDVGFATDLITLQFVEFAGVNNFIVNDGLRYVIDDFTDLPMIVAPGVTVEITEGTGFEPSLLTLTGAIDSFEIGGQEVSIDNVSIVPEPTSLLLLFAGAACIRRRVKVTH